MTPYFSQDERSLSFVVWILSNFANHPQIHPWTKSRQIFHRNYWISRYRHFHESSWKNSLCPIGNSQSRCFENIFAYPLGYKVFGRQQIYPTFRKAKFRRQRFGRLERKPIKEKLSLQRIGREKQREFRDDKGKTIVAIPLIVRVVIGRVQPRIVVIAIYIEQIRITIGIVWNVSHITIPRMLSGLNFIRHLKCHNISHQVSSFFESSYIHHSIWNLGRK